MKIIIGVQLLDTPVLAGVVFVHGLAAILAVSLGLYAVVHHREKQLGRVFVGICAAVTVWLLGAAARLFTLDHATFITVSTFQYLGVSTLSVWFVLFALLYSGRDRWVTPVTVGGLFVVPLCSVGLLATNTTHWLFFSSFSATMLGSHPVLVPNQGLAFWGLAAYSWVLLGSGLVLVMHTAFQQSPFYRLQSILIVFAIVLTWPLNLAHIIFEQPHPVIDTSPLGFVIAGSLVAVALFVTPIVDVVPAARSRVLDEIDDVMIVLDSNGRIADVNRPGRRLLCDDEPIGRDATTVLPEALTTPLGDDATTTELDIGGRRRFYRHHDVPLGPEDNRGRVIVLTDITPEIHARRELESQNERLEEFTSVVSHDLRNPLNVAKGHLELVRSDTDDPRLEKVDGALDRMETLVDELLTLARHGTSVTAVEQVNLRQAARDAWEHVHSPEANLELGTDPGTCEADRERILQLFENLFRNAIEHGGPGVTVRVGRTDDGFFVADDGPGIPDEHREQIFEKGYTTSTDGTGFGLTIVQNIVDAHDWSISTREASGGGARFDIRTQSPTRAVPDQRQVSSAGS
jgi:nitrogen-specific signal transduction histidine kinase